ncbi:TPA: hypothetical protein EYP45_03760 [Candidatus Peregrinibacteria bacterium]|nr:hypothetical protein [Candidatus Peregrinibacteria bacterium]
MMQQTCRISGKKFLITDEDIQFYKAVGIISNNNENKSGWRGLPTLCPEERMRRRLSWRNERVLHNRNCSKTGRKIISMYAPNVNFPVYDNDFWWSDDWDAKQEFLDFNFSQKFFSQFQNLLNRVPRMARIQQGTCENSTFTNCASYNKNCYLLFSSNRNEDCSYGTAVLSSQNSLDNLHLKKSELCYESVDCEECYSSSFLQNSKRCSDSHFLKNCIGCTNCFGSVNLRNKEYYFLNKKYSREEYFKKLDGVKLSEYSQSKNLREYFQKYFQKFSVKSSELLQNHNSSGNYLYNSKDSHECWDSLQLESCKFTGDSENIKTSYDVNYYGCTETNELLYECEGVGHGVYNTKFSKLCWGGCKNLDYCIECFKTSNCFGCIGLKNAQFCIFNKQYSEQEYYALREKIITHMKGSEEWGEFFPTELSPFGYNETIAQEFFPETESSIQKISGYWAPEKTSAQYDGPQYDIPDKISDVPNDITQKILTCKISGKLYKIIKSELDFYRKMNIPIPRKCPDQRHKERMSLRNPRKLFTRKCDKCNAEISTTYVPGSPEKVFCEKCYLESVY